VPIYTYMTRVAESALRRAVLGEVRDELKQRSPADGYRPYDAPRVSRDVQDAFESVAKDKSADAVISVSAVVNAYAKTLKSTLDVVNTKGPTVVTHAEASAVAQPEMRERMVSLRADLARGGKPLGDDELLRRAARFVTDHSAPIGQSGNAIDVLFPAFDVGNAANWDDKEPGIDARLITDPKAALTILKMLEGDASPAEIKRLRTFDPAKERLILVLGSDDETHFFPAAIDRKTGKTRGFDSQHNEVNFANVETKADFEALFGKGSAKSVKDGDFYTAAYDRLHALVDAGRSLPIATLDPPELDTAKLTAAAGAALQKYFGGISQVPTGDDLSDTDRKTLEAIRKAVHEGDSITVGEKYGDPILLMPRRFDGAPTEDWAVGWAVSALFQAVPELRRFYNVNATPQQPNAD
jgi:hypothetical protein